LHVNEIWMWLEIVWSSVGNKKYVYSLRNASKMCFWPFVKNFHPGLTNCIESPFKMMLVLLRKKFEIIVEFVNDQGFSCKNKGISEIVLI